MESKRASDLTVTIDEPTQKVNSLITKYHDELEVISKLPNNKNLPIALKSQLDLIETLITLKEHPEEQSQLMRIEQKENGNLLNVIFKQFERTYVYQEWKEIEKEKPSSGIFNDEGYLTSHYIRYHNKLPITHFRIKEVNPLACETNNANKILTAFVIKFINSLNPKLIANLFFFNIIPRMQGVEFETRFKVFPLRAIFAFLDQIKDEEMIQNLFGCNEFYNFLLEKLKARDQLKKNKLENKSIFKILYAILKNESVIKYRNQLVYYIVKQTSPNLLDENGNSPLHVVLYDASKNDYSLLQVILKELIKTASVDAESFKSIMLQTRDNPTEEKQQTEISILNELVKCFFEEKINFDILPDTFIKILQTPTEKLLPRDKRLIANALEQTDKSGKTILAVIADTDSARFKTIIDLLHDKVDANTFKALLSKKAGDGIAILNKTPLALKHLGKILEADDKKDEEPAPLCDWMFADSGAEAAAAIVNLIDNFKNKEITNWLKYISRFSPEQQDTFFGKLYDALTRDPAIINNIINIDLLKAILSDARIKNLEKRSDLYARFICKALEHNIHEIPNPRSIDRTDQLIEIFISGMIKAIRGSSPESNTQFENFLNYFLLFKPEHQLRLITHKLDLFKQACEHLDPARFNVFFDKLKDLIKWRIENNAKTKNFSGLAWLTCYRHYDDKILSIINNETLINFLSVPFDDYKKTGLLLILECQDEKGWLAFTARIDKFDFDTMNLFTSHFTQGCKANLNILHLALTKHNPHVAARLLQWMKPETFIALMQSDEMLSEDIIKSIANNLVNDPNWKFNMKIWDLFFKPAGWFLSKSSEDHQKFYRENAAIKKIAAAIFDLGKKGMVIPRQYALLKPHLSKEEFEALEKFTERKEAEDAIRDEVKDEKATQKDEAHQLHQIDLASSAELKSFGKRI